MAGALAPDACLERIAAGALEPVYLITGPDTEMKGRLVTALLETVEAELRDFNCDRQHAAEKKDEQRRQLWGVLDLARMLPMMAPRRIVVLHGAEKVLAAFRESDAGAEELEAFEAFLASPEPHATVAFVTEADPDGRTKAVKLLQKYATVVLCDPLEDASDGAAWVRAEAAREGVRIEPAAVRLLAFLAGNDIGRLRAEFERALLFASGTGIITESAVEEVVGAQTSRDTWALNNALRRPDAAAALRELAMKLDAGEVPVMILGQIASFVRKDLPADRSATPDRLRRAVEAVMRTDLAMKTSRGEPRVLLERLIVELCG